MVGPLHASLVRSLDPERSIAVHQQYLGLEVVGRETVGPWFGQLLGLPDVSSADIWRLRAIDDDRAELRIFHAPGGLPASTRRQHAWDIGPLGVSFRSKDVAAAWDELQASDWKPFSGRPETFNFAGGDVRFHEILVPAPDNAGWALMENLDANLPEGPYARRIFVNTNVFADADEALSMYRDLMGFVVRTEYDNPNDGQNNVFGLPRGKPYKFWALRAPENVASNSLGINFMTFADAPDQLDLRDCSGPAFEGRCLDSYECADLDAFWQRFQASEHAPRLVSAPVSIESDGLIERRAMTFRGPGGTLIQIAQTR
jgi:catechol 2,3-dioxygenase-like lactoylglutathione lyase family enzyme